MAAVDQPLTLDVIWPGIDRSLDRFRMAKDWLVEHEIEFWHTFPAYCDPLGCLLEDISDEDAIVNRWDVHLRVTWTFSSHRDAVAFKLRWG